MFGLYRTGVTGYWKAFIAQHCTPHHTTNKPKNTLREGVYFHYITKLKHPPNKKGDEREKRKKKRNETKRSPPVLIIITKNK